MKSFALALGAGGARGFAHIAVFEALDELGLKPAAIAGSSIGALGGALYAAGMSGKAIRRHVIGLAHDRVDVWRRLMTARAGTIGDLFGGNFSAAMQLDAEKVVAQFVPESVPDAFASLAIPLTVVASDLHGRCEVTFARGPLRRPLAASIALPTIMQPVVIEDRVLIDGGATNPLPFDLLRGTADIIVAVDASGPPGLDRGLPNAIEALYATVLVMTGSIINEKLKHEAPDVLVRPNVGTFRGLDFFQASAILRLAEPLKLELKAKLEALL